VDCFGELPIREIVGLLTAVGLSSPPSWIKPYCVLSGGERFRCDLARALSFLPLPPGEGRGEGAAEMTSNVASPHPNPLPKGEGTERLVVFDEFTSVVDRTVAKIASAAVAKAIRGRRIG